MTTPKRGRTTPRASAPDRPLTADFLRSRKKPTIVPVQVCLDSELARTYNLAKQHFDNLDSQLRMLRNQRPDADHTDLVAQRDQAEAELRDAREAMEGQVVTIKVKSVAPHQLDELKRKHRPTATQVKEAQELADRMTAGLPDKEARDIRRAARIDVNPDTYPPALWALCSYDPVLTYEEALEFWQDPNWSEADLQTIHTACLIANQQRPTVDLGKVSGPTSDSVRSLPTATDTGSPTASS